MNLFEIVKASVSVPDTAKMYGLQPNHHGMVRCPFHDERHPSTKALYEAYKKWCEDNAEMTLSMKSFANHVAQYTDAYHLVSDNNIYTNKGKRCRGYQGVEVIDHDNSFLKIHFRFCVHAYSRTKPNINCTNIHASTRIQML